MRGGLVQAVALLLGALALPVRAQEAGAGAHVDGGSGPSLLEEIDAAAADSTGPPAAPVAPSSPAARSFQSFNPDISVIFDGTAGYATKPSYSMAGDDPDLKGGSADRPAGFTLQEMEIAFQAVVDPYFRADFFLTIPNLTGVEVEEAVVTTTSLPAGFQVRAGVFRSAFGRQNGQHLHLQDFTRRPLINEAFEQIVEIVGYTTRQDSDSLHLLCLPELRLQALTLGQVSAESEDLDTLGRRQDSGIYLDWRELSMTIHIVNLKTADISPLRTLSDTLSIPCPVVLRRPFGDSMIEDVLQSLLTGEPDVLRVCVEDFSLRIEDHISSTRCFDQGSVFAFTFPQRLFGPCALGDVTKQREPARLFLPAVWDNRDLDRSYRTVFTDYVINESRVKTDPRCNTSQALQDHRTGGWRDVIDQGLGSELLLIRISKQLQERTIGI